MRFDDLPVRSIRVEEPLPGDVWPMTIPAVAQVAREGLVLAPGVTFLVGENGSGKSTLVEAVAEAYGLPPEGGSTQGGRTTYRSESDLGRVLRLERGAGSARWGFFLRAETMHHWYTYVANLSNTGDVGDPSRPPASAYHPMSHGESFLEVLNTRINSPGFYCLDEPEAALSFTSSLALLGHLAQMQRGRSQVLCATHSPLLAALPGARILEVGPWGLRETTWRDLELVEHWQRFLDAPERYLRHVID